MTEGIAQDVGGGVRGADGNEESVAMATYSAYAGTANGSASRARGSFSGADRSESGTIAHVSVSNPRSESENGWE